MLLAFACLFAKSQQKPLVTGTPISYDGIIKTDSSFKKTKLYSMGIEWFTNTFNNGKAVLQMQDLENGIIIGKANFYVALSAGGMFGTIVDKYISYFIKLSFKDGKVKYELYDFIDQQGGPSITDGEPTYKGMGSKMAKKFYTHIQDQVKIHANELITSLNKTFTMPITAKNNDW